MVWPARREGKEHSALHAGSYPDRGWRRSFAALSERDQFDCGLFETPSVVPHFLCPDLALVAVLSRGLERAAAAALRRKGCCGPRGPLGHPGRRTRGATTLLPGTPFPAQSWQGQHAQTDSW